VAGCRCPPKQYFLEMIIEASGLRLGLMPVNRPPRTRGPLRRAVAVVVIPALVLTACEKPIAGKAHALPAMVLFKADLPSGYDAEDHDTESSSDKVMFDDKVTKECVTATESMQKVIGKVYSQSFSKSDLDNFRYIASAARSFPSPELVQNDVAKWRDTVTGTCLEEQIKGSIEDEGGTDSLTDLKVSWEAPPSGYPRSVVRILNVSVTVSESLSSFGDSSDPSDPTSDPSSSDPSSSDPTDDTITVKMHVGAAFLAKGTVEAEVDWNAGGDDLTTELEKRLIVTVANRIDPH